jgi:hypothetical protein
MDVSWSEAQRAETNAIARGGDRATTTESGDRATTQSIGDTKRQPNINSLFNKKVHAVIEERGEQKVQKCSRIR